MYPSPPYPPSSTPTPMCPMCHHNVRTVAICPATGTPHASMMIAHQAPTTPTSPASSYHRHKILPTTMLMGKGIPSTLSITSWVTKVQAFAGAHGSESDAKMIEAWALQYLLSAKQKGVLTSVDWVNMPLEFGSEFPENPPLVQKAGGTKIATVPH
eukprot:PhF_6_TR39672/c0_g1_i3/m.58912